MVSIFSNLRELSEGIDYDQLLPIWRVYDRVFPKVFVTNNDPGGPLWSFAGHVQQTLTIAS
jgi:hypothetical protein